MRLVCWLSKGFFARSIVNKESLSAFDYRGKVVDRAVVKIVRSVLLKQ